jgi:hypothetical protein
MALGVSPLKGIYLPSAEEIRDSAVKSNSDVRLGTPYLPILFEKTEHTASSGCLLGNPPEGPELQLLTAKHFVAMLGTEWSQVCGAPHRLRVPAPASHRISAVSASHLMAHTPRAVVSWSSPACRERCRARLDGARSRLPPKSQSRVDWPYCGRPLIGEMSALRAR